jgi:Zn-dependent M28 family amino/carboxypeptidase
VILSAHYDAAPTGYVFGERSLRTASRLSERARLLLGPWRVIFWGCLAPLLPILGLRMAGLDDNWVSILQVVPTVLLILAVFLLIDIALSETVPGAYDNASGVAAVLSVAEDLRATPAENLDVWVLLPGSEESLDEGMRAFMRRHRKELDKENTLFINVDSVGYGTPHYQTAQGPIITYPMDPELVEFCEAIATAEPRYGARPVRVSLSDDATPVRVRGFRVTSIIGLKEGLPPPWYHTHEDTPDKIDEGAMTNAVEFVQALVGLLDRDAART